jgi:hypothetical protein
MPVAIFSTSESECGIGRDFPELRTTFEAKTSSFDRLISIVKRFRDFAEKSA